MFGFKPPSQAENSETWMHPPTCAMALMPSNSLCLHEFDLLASACWLQIPHNLHAQQVQPYTDLAASLEDFRTLKALHYDEARQQFLDYGDHSEDVSLQV